MNRLLRILIAVAFLPAPDVFAVEKPEAPSTLSGASLVPAETLFFMRIPSGERLWKLFLEGHESSLKPPVIAEMEQAASKNPVLRNRPTIEAAPGSADTVKALGALGTGELVVAMLPGTDGELRYVAAVTDLVTDAAEKFRSATAAAAGLKWEPDEGSSSVWHSETEEIGKIRMAERSGYLVVATAAEAFEFVLEAKPGDPKALASLSLYQESLDNAAGEPLIAYFSNFMEVRAWLSQSEDADRDSLNRLLQGRMEALEGVSWKWSSEGAGSVGRDHFEFFLDKSAAESFREAVEQLRPIPPKLITAETLGYVRASVLAGKLAELPFFEGLPFGKVLRVGGAMKGSGHAIYVVDAGAEPDAAFRAWILDTGGDASEWVQESVDRRVDGARILEKVEGGIRLNAPLCEEQWFVRTVGDLLVVAPDDASAAHFAKKAQSEEESRSSAEWLEVESPGTLSAPFLEIRINRAAIMHRVFQYATVHYETLAADLLANGFSPPESVPKFSKFDRFYGPVASWIGSEGDSVTVENAIPLQDSGSTFLTTTAVTASFVLEKPLLQTMRAWEAAFEETAKKSRAAAANPFDILGWSSVLISPLVTQGNGPTLFLDFAVLEELCAIADPVEPEGTERSPGASENPLASPSASRYTNRRDGPSLAGLADGLAPVFPGAFVAPPRSSEAR